MIYNDFHRQLSFDHNDVRCRDSLYIIVELLSVTLWYSVLLFVLSGKIRLAFFLSIFFGIEHDD